MKSVRTKEKILRKAFKVFAKKGYEGARIDDISRAVGINKATIYYYFEGKRELYERVLYAELCKLIPQLMHALTDEERDFSKKIEKVVDIYFEFFKANPDTLRLILREIASGGRFLIPILQKIAEREDYVKKGGAPALFSRWIKEEGPDPINVWLNIVGMSNVHFILAPFIEVFYNVKIDDEFLKKRKESILAFVERFFK
ncbi:MAG: TetR/AcrR family transcriptional regulator [Deferribacteres bacterium]|nr:TetR/AcrR family transcriptional regulator [Deferribacteres bacterium]